MFYLGIDIVKNTHVAYLVDDNKRLFSRPSLSPTLLREQKVYFLN